MENRSNDIAWLKIETSAIEFFCFFHCFSHCQNEEKILINLLKPICVCVSPFDSLTAGGTFLHYMGQVVKILTTCFENFLSWSPLQCIYVTALGFGYWPSVRLVLWTRSQYCIGHPLGNACINTNILRLAARGAPGLRRQPNRQEYRRQNDVIKQMPFAL